MRKYTVKERKIDSYDIGNGLRLMNVKNYNDDGKLDSVETYIGEDANGFSCVGTTEGLSEPGTIFSYASYVRMQEANLKMYLDIFFSNIG